MEETLSPGNALGQVRGGGVSVWRLLVFGPHRRLDVPSHEPLFVRAFELATERSALALLAESHHADLSFR